MSTLSALQALQAHYDAMTNAAAQGDWDALTRIEREAAQVRARLEATPFELAADERDAARACIERIMQHSETIRAHAVPMLDEADEALREARAAVTQTTRGHAMSQAYGRLSPK